MESPRAHDPQDSRERGPIEHVFFFLLLTVVTIAFLALISDFLMPVFWAAVLAVVFYPLHTSLREQMRGRSSVAALVAVVVILVLVILPLVLVGMAVSSEAQSLYARIQSGELDPNGFLDRLLPLALGYLERFGIDVAAIRDAATRAIAGASQWIATSVLELGQDALRVGALFALMVYVLFFFLRDGELILDAIVRALPLGDARERHLFAKFAEVTRATIQGTIVVAVVQGALGGLLFWIVGINAPALWGVVMGVMSLLPAVGAGLVWLPAGVILIATGSVARGIIVLAAGGALVSTVDNVLRPMLVSRGTRMPDYLVLLATLGGIAVFGLSGFVIGPVLASLFLAVWRMFEEEYIPPDGIEPVSQSGTVPSVAEIEKK